MEETPFGMKFKRTVRGEADLSPQVTAALRAIGPMVKAVQAGDTDAVPEPCRCDTACFRCGGAVTWQAFVDGIPDRLCGGSDGHPCPFRNGWARDPGAGDAG